MRMKFMGTVAAGLLLAAAFDARADQLVVSDFEAEQLGWGIPDWAVEKADHVAKKAELSQEVASAGKKSLKIDAQFPGQTWTAAVVEHEDYLDFTPYEKVAVDVFLPAEAPQGLKGNIVLTVGDAWTWTEQLKSIELVPGKWTTVQANIADGSKDWKKTKVDGTWRSDIRKIDIRIISDKKPSYTGPIYIDNVRAEGGATGNANTVVK